MSTTVLPQLEEIASELEAQEEALATQLKAVQEKLSGIRAVLPMFDEEAATTTAISAATEESASNLPDAAAEKASELPKKKTKTSTKKKATSAKKSKKDGRAADWQKYTRPGVKNQSIPDAVKLVLATQPDKNFKIAEVMEALFKEGMPKAQYLKARNRVSNVLSGGVRAGDWHRGERSTYRMSAT